MPKKIKLPVLIMTLLLGIFVLAACGGPSENDFSDKTGDQEASAEKGSLDTIQGKYYEKGQEGNYVVFAKDGEGVYSQHGSYEISEDGIISLAYDVSKIPMDYTITESEDDETLVTLQNGNIELNCTYKNGTAGLHKQEGSFTGTYSVDDGTAFVFNEDGTFRQVTPFTYVVDGDKLTETFPDSEQTFTWKEKKGEIRLKIGDETVQKLIPAE